jgi:hypothetical protein
MIADCFGPAGEVGLFAESGEFVSERPWPVWVSRFSHATMVVVNEIKTKFVAFQIMRSRVLRNRLRSGRGDVGHFMRIAVKEVRFNLTEGQR